MHPNRDFRVEGLYGLEFRALGLGVRHGDCQNRLGAPKQSQRVHVSIW